MSGRISLNIIGCGSALTILGNMHFLLISRKLVFQGNIKKLKEHSESADLRRCHQTFQVISKRLTQTNLKKWKLLSWQLNNSNFMELSDRIYEEFQMLLMQVSSLKKGEIS